MLRSIHCTRTRHRSGRVLKRRRLGHEWIARFFLNESNVLLSMCLPCIHPPTPTHTLSLFSLPISHSLPSFLSIFHNYFSPIPPPSHISAIPGPFSEWRDWRAKSTSRFPPCACVCVCEERGPSQPLAPPGDQRKDRTARLICKDGEKTEYLNKVQNIGL